MRFKRLNAVEPCLFCRDISATIINSKEVDMSTEACGVLVPTEASPVHDYEDGFGDCLLRVGHGGEHLCNLSAGEYMLWEPASGCEDQGCEYFPDCDCYDYQMISQEEAMDILNAQ